MELLPPNNNFFVKLVFLRTLMLLFSFENIALQIVLEFYDSEAFIQNFQGWLHESFFFRSALLKVISIS